MAYRKLSFRTTRAVFCVIGLMLLAISTFWGAHSFEKTATALRSSGKVVQLVEGRSMHGRVFYPVFCYLDGKGISHTISSDLGAYPASRKVGDIVTVLYFAGREDRAEIEDWTVLWAGPLILSLLGAMFLTAGLVMYIWPQAVLRIERSSRQDALIGQMGGNSQRED